MSIKTPQPKKMQECIDILQEEVKSGDIADFTIFYYNKKNNAVGVIAPCGESMLFSPGQFFILHPVDFLALLEGMGYLPLDHLKYLCTLLYEYMKGEGMNKDEIINRLVIEDEAEYLQKALYKDVIEHLENLTENK